MARLVVVRDVVVVGVGVVGNCRSFTVVGFTRMVEPGRAEGFGCRVIKVCGGRFMDSLLVVLFEASMPGFTRSNDSNMKFGGS